MILKIEVFKKIDLNVLSYLLVNRSGVRQVKPAAKIKNPLDRSERVCELVGEIYAARTTLPA